MKWETIDKAPKDGTCILLYYTNSQYGPDVICEGWWFSSPKEIDDGWETSFGFIGEPSYFCYLSFEWNTFDMTLQEKVDQAYQEGRDAYHAGKTSEDNPYNGVDKDHQWEAWKEGYYNAFLED